MCFPAALGLRDLSRGRARSPGAGRFASPPCGARRRARGQRPLRVRCRAVSGLESTLECASWVPEIGRERSVLQLAPRSRTGTAAPTRSSSSSSPGRGGARGEGGTGSSGERARRPFGVGSLRVGGVRACAHACSLAQQSRRFAAPGRPLFVLCAAFSLLFLCALSLLCELA